MAYNPCFPDKVDEKIPSTPNTTNTQQDPMGTWGKNNYEIVGYDKLGKPIYKVKAAKKSSGKSSLEKTSIPIRLRPPADAASKTPSNRKVDIDIEIPPLEGLDQPEWKGVEIEEEVYKPTITNIIKPSGAGGGGAVKLLTTSDEPISLGIDVATHDQEVKNVSRIKFLTGADSNVKFTLKEVVEQVTWYNEDLTVGGVENVKTAIVYVDVYYK